MNLGYCYYHKPGKKHVDYGRSIVDKEPAADLQKTYFQIEAPDVIRLEFKIIYPGLLIGLGYEHPKVEENDFAAGFMFDHTTGMPYIPGSSVKGILRSAFPNNDNDEGRIKFINGLLENNLKYKEIYAIEKRIFGNRPNKKRDTERKYQDIFYDGYVSEVTTEAGGLFAEEYITPHKDAVTNPIPIKLLKIAPANIITLQFGLNPDKAGKLTPAERLKLYAGIILYLGLGAKTNVGFGQLDEKFTQTILKRKEQQEQEQARIEKEQAHLAQMNPVDRIFEEFKKNLPDIVNAMRNDKIDSALKPELAQAMKERYISLKIWHKPKKKKDFKRVAYLQTILD